jgi:hypothetical protein
MFWKKKKKKGAAEPDPAAPEPGPGAHDDAIDEDDTEGQAPRPPAAPGDQPKRPFTGPPPARR